MFYINFVNYRYLYCHLFNRNGFFFLLNKIHLKNKKHQHKVGVFLLFEFSIIIYSPIKISNILIAASLIFVPGPKTATAPASNKY